MAQCIVKDSAHYRICPSTIGSGVIKCFTILPERSGEKEQEEEEENERERESVEENGNKKGKSCGKSRAERKFRAKSLKQKVIAVQVIDWQD